MLLTNFQAFSLTSGFQSKLFNENKTTLTIAP